MREKLIELLKQFEIPIMFGDIEIMRWNIPTEEILTALADHLIANGVTIAKWIPVTERLPEGDKVVLCYKADRGIRFGKLLDATYADGVQAFMDRDRTFAFGVTHWMPLPEPPKGE